MDVLRNPVVYLSLAILFIVAFFQIKQAVEAFMDPKNFVDSSGNMVLLDNSGNIVKLDAMGSPVPPTSDDISSFFRRAFGSFTAFQSSAATGVSSKTDAEAAPTPAVDESTVPEEDSIEKSEEKKKALADSIATQIKDKLLADRAITPMSPTPASYNPSECLYQGQEYSTAQPSKAFDSNEYIRKDSIPCWGCTLPA